MVISYQIYYCVVYQTHGYNGNKVMDKDNVVDVFVCTEKRHMICCFYNELPVKVLDAGAGCRVAYVDTVDPHYKQNIAHTHVHRKKTILITCATTLSARGIFSEFVPFWMC